MSLHLCNRMVYGELLDEKFCEHSDETQLVHYGNVDNQRLQTEVSPKRFGCCLVCAKPFAHDGCIGGSI